MSKWKTIRIQQELLEEAKKEVEKSQYKSLSEFVSEAIRLRLDELEKSSEKIIERYIEYPLIYERLLYTTNHTWAIITPNGNIKIGLSDYAQKQLKGIVSIQTHPVGYNVTREDPFGVIETWMFMFDLYAPVSGKIIKLNKIVQDEPSIINKDGYEKGWIAEIKPNNLIKLEEELRDLMSFHEYKMLVSKLNQARSLSI